MKVTYRSNIPLAVSLENVLHLSEGGWKIKFLPAYQRQEGFLDSATKEARTVGEAVRDFEQLTGLRAAETCYTLPDYRKRALYSQLQILFEPERVRRILSRNKALHTFLAEGKRYSGPRVLLLGSTHSRNLPG